MPRCLSIYIATVIFWVIIAAILAGCYFGATIILVTAMPSALLFVNIFAGIRFFVGIVLAMEYTLLAIFWFLVIILRAGQAGMFLKLHQGMRPGIGDFGVGIARYFWRFLKGYFHLAVLYGIPFFIFLTWVVRQYGSYSSSIFVSKWNVGLVQQFAHNARVGWTTVIISHAIIYLVLMIWDTSVVLEGATFQNAFLRAFRFARKNPLRILIIGAVNYVIFHYLPLLAFIKWEPDMDFRDPISMFTSYNDMTGRVGILLLAILILSPVLTYTRYLLYIPSQPFGSRKILRRPIPQANVIIDDDLSGVDGSIFDGPHQSEPDDGVLRL